MAAKPRVTVRLAPSTLHALAYIAERDGQAPAEVARMMLGALVESTLASRGWAEDHQDQWRAWLAEQAARGARAESPDQADYDRLAAGTAYPASPILRAEQHDGRPIHKPLADTIAADAARVQRTLGRLAARNARS